MRRSYGLAAALLSAGLLAACGGTGMVPSSSSSAQAERHPSAPEAVLYSFTGSSDGDGATPWAGLLNVKGTFYGTTEDGGTYCVTGGGCGTVFAITRSGKETVLHSFGGPDDGAHPVPGLINGKGTLYGTTNAGGAHGGGIVFTITTSGTESVLHSFGGSGDGAFPFAPLLDVKGTLYGTTDLGGADGYGSVFSITTSGAETVLHSFGGSGDGEYPYAGFLSVKNTLYGTTHEGGAAGDGTVYAITTSGKESVLYSFKGGTDDGRYPFLGRLISVKGTLYGMTDSGGANNAGTAFAVTRSGSETVLHSFGGSGDGAYPEAGLTNVAGRLYGTTLAGGANSDGTVFSLSRTLQHRPAGGSPTKPITKDAFHPFGATISEAPK